MVQRGSRGVALLILDLGVRRGGWSASRPGRFTPGKDPVPIVQEAGWAPGSVWAPLQSGKGKGHPITGHEWPRGVVEV
jgi:hypothetical protein